MNPTIKARIESIRRGEVPEGYKRTKAGILPVDWESNYLSQLAEKSKTKNREKRYTKILTNSANEGIISQTDYFDKQLANNNNIEGYYIVKNGDFVYNPRISVAAPCGPINCYHGEEIGVMSPLYTVFSIDMKEIQRDYIEQFFSSTSWHRYMKSVANYGVRSDRMNLSDEDFFLLPIPMPKRKEQEKIAEILAGQDRVIALKEELLAEKQKQKKYLMQQLLTGKKRLPGFSGEWIKSLLGDLFRERVETNCTELRLLAITGGQGVIPRDELELKDNSSEDKSKYKKICVGDIGYNTMRMWQGVSAFSNYEGIVSPAYTILMPNSEIDAKFFAYLFKLPSIIFLFYRYSQGLVDDTRNLKYENLKRIRVLFPQDKKEQSAIAGILLTADKEIELLQKDIEQEKLKKKSLMQLLLTGIVRVDELVS